MSMGCHLKIHFESLIISSTSIQRSSIYMHIKLSYYYSYWYHNPRDPQHFNFRLSFILHVKCSSIIPYKLSPQKVTEEILLLTEL